MPNPTLTAFRAEQGQTTVDLNALVAVTDAGQTKVVTINEILTAMGGYTAVANPVDPMKCAKISLFTDKDNGSGGELNAGVMFWNQEDYDTAGFFDIGQASRFTIPAGVSKVRIDLSLEFFAVNKGAKIVKNGTTVPIVAGNCGAIIPFLNLTTGDLPVTAGDYFEMITLNPYKLKKGEATWMKITATELL